jgi:hypothetical protein
MQLCCDVLIPYDFLVFDAGLVVLWCSSPLRYAGQLCLNWQGHAYQFASPLEGLMK